MSLLQTLAQKPWLDKSAGAAIDESLLTSIHAKKIALNIFLAVVTVLFSLFIVTFLARSQYPDFKALAGDIWQPFYNPTRLWLNTGILFVSGVAIQAALSVLRKKQTRYALAALVMALVFALQFLVAQLMLWQHLQTLGYYVASNPANSYFYVLTAVHGVHVLGGLLVLTQALVNFWRKSSLAKLNESVVLCTRYWHYLFALWLVLFALMTSSPETYKTLAALCGY